MLELARRKNRKSAAFDLDHLLFAKFGEGSGKGFANSSQFCGEDALGSGELNPDGMIRPWPRATSDEPVGQAGFDVFQRQILQLPHEDTEMTAHGTQHAESEFRLTPKQGEDAGLLDQQNLGGLEGAGVGRVTGFGRQRHFGEGLADTEHMNDLLLAGGGDAMNVHRAALDDVKAAGRVPFVKQVVPFLQRFDDSASGYFLEVRSGDAGEKLATAQSIYESSLSELRKVIIHSPSLGRVAPDINHPIRTGTALQFRLEPLAAQLLNQRRREEWSDNNE